MELQLLNRLVHVKTNTVEPTHYLIFNPYNNAIVKVNEEVHNRITKADFKEEEKANLLRLQMLRPTNVSEDIYFKRWLNNNRYNTRGHRNYIFVLTGKCNFACPYCVEQNSNPLGSMSPEIMNNAINYLVNDINNNRIGKIMVTLFGGEPMLTVHKYTEQLKKLREYLVSKHIDTTYYIITNGSLLNKAKIKLLQDIQMDKIRITIDGLEETHNRNRPYKNKKGSFKTIIKNLYNFKGIKNTSITIGINVTRNNLPDAIALIDILKEIKEQDVNIEGVTIKPVMDYYDNKNRPGCSSTLNLMEDKEFTDQIRSALKYAIDSGFRVPPAVGVTFCSMITNERDVVVAPDGGLYSCPAAIGNEDFKIGDISSSPYCAFSNNYYDTLLNNLEECKNCEYLTLCLGGCGYEAYTLTGNKDSKFCVKKVYENNLEKQIKFEYYRVKNEKVKAVN